MDQGHGNRGHARGADRLDAFVDAAFAFSLTLLMIAGSQPLLRYGDLIEALKRIPAFAACFALIAMYWLGHRTFSRLVGGRDNMTTWLSLAIVFAVLIYVFPLRFLADAGAAAMSGGWLPGWGTVRTIAELRGAYVLFGLGGAVMAGLYVALYCHALKSGERLGVTEAELPALVEERRVWIAIGLPSLLCVLLAVVVPLRFAPWAPGLAFWTIPLFIFGPELLRRPR